MNPDKDTGLKIKREFSAISLVKTDGRIHMIYNGDKQLYEKLQRACRKRGIFFDFKLSKCG